MQILAYWDHERPPAAAAAAASTKGSSAKNGADLLKHMISGPHTLSIKQFRKLQTSPLYGISQAEVDAGVDIQAEESAENAGGLRLREYQVHQTDAACIDIGHPLHLALLTVSSTQGRYISDCVVSVISTAGHVLCLHAKSGLNRYSILLAALY